MRENQVTPWFHLIYQSGLLSQWWTQLMQSDLESVSVDPSIRLLQYPPLNESFPFRVSEKDGGRFGNGSWTGQMRVSS